MSEVERITGPFLDGTVIDYDFEAVERFNAGSKKEQTQQLYALHQERPEDQLAIINAAQNPHVHPDTRVLALLFLKDAARERPEATLPIIGKALELRGYLTPAYAVGVLAISARFVPDKIEPYIAQALQKQPKVRTNLIGVAIELEKSQPDTALGLLEQLVKDPALSWWSVSKNLEQLVDQKPELFVASGDDASQAAIEKAKQWRDLLLNSAKTHKKPIDRYAMKLEDKVPGAGLNLLKEYPDSSIVSFLNADRHPFFRPISPARLERLAVAFEAIKKDPELRKKLDAEIEEEMNQDDLVKYIMADFSTLVREFPALSVYVNKVNQQPKRISHESDEYKENREKAKQEPAKNYIFGTDFEDKFAEAEDIATIRQLVQLSRQKLAAVRGKNVSPHLEKILKKSLEAAAADETCLDADNTDDASILDYAAWLTGHVRNERKRQQESAEKISDYERTFRTTMENYGIDPALIDARLGENRTVFFDFINAMGLKSVEGQHISGDFSEYKARSRVRSFESLEAQEDTFYHEALHLLSGRSLVQIVLRSRASTSQSQVINNQRVGLRFTAKNKPNNRTFHWLNEAVTEDLNIDIFKRPKERASYKIEREVFDLLCEAGIVPVSKELFRAAYFENYNAGAPSGERVPHWQALQKQLQKAYGPGILNKLQELHDEHDTLTVREYLKLIKKQNWPEPESELELELVAVPARVEVEPVLETVKPTGNFKRKLLAGLTAASLFIGAGSGGLSGVQVYETHVDSNKAKEYERKHDTANAAYFRELAAYDKSWIAKFGEVSLGSLLVSGVAAAGLRLEARKRNTR